MRVYVSLCPSKHRSCLYTSLCPPPPSQCTLVSGCVCACQRASSPLASSSPADFYSPLRINAGVREGGAEGKKLPTPLQAPAKRKNTTHHSSRHKASLLRDTSTRQLLFSHSLTSSCFYSLPRPRPGAFSRMGTEEEGEAATLFGA